jgi:Flp pilus assembly pilin Flp
MNSFKAVLLDEKGANPLDYVGTTALAFIIAAALIGGIDRNRYQLGGSMANVLDYIIASWDGGGGGTIDYNLDFEPGRPRANTEP